MRECPRCKITFHLNDRSRCLYCDTRLMTVDLDQTDLKKKMDHDFLAQVTQPVIRQVVKDHGVEAYTRHQFIVASYFRTRTFHFTYSFSRHEFLIGPEFKRQLIQPFTLPSLLMIPWLVLDIFDSFFCRMIYVKYCSKCGWKFQRSERNGEHYHEQCEYNREYKEVIESILKGDIMRDESNFRRLGQMKKNAGRKSAYWDLCQTRDFFSAVLDVTTIWFSVCLWIILIVVVFFPIIIQGIYMLEV